MKKIIIAVIVLLLVAGLVACANPLEAAVSQMAENNDAQDSPDSSASSDGQTDIDINEDGSSINISGDDGNVTIQGDENGMAWPGDKLPSSVPEMTGVKVTMVMDMDGGILVGFEECDQATADAYVAKLQGSGWESSMNINSEDGYALFFAKGNESLQFGWSKNDKTGSIVYGVSE